MAGRGEAPESIWTWVAGGVLVLAAAIVLALQTGPAFGAGEPAHDHASHDHTTCLPLPGVPKLCSHGPDKAPDGVDPTRMPSRRELERRAATGSYDPATSASYTAAATTTPKVACIGDGKAGARVQAIYARPKDRPNRYSDALPLIRKFAGLADSYVNRSASQVGAGRRIRFVTENCKLKVLKVTLTAKGDNSFNDTVRQLANKGFNKSKRKYLIWMDSKVLCGVGSIFPDDRGSLTNENNQITGFARVDRTCWGGGVEAHELFHTLGAVQQSAPHSTPYGHCYDERDAMCYLDGSIARMRSICPKAIEWQIDCNHDDYFNPKPKAGSYLDKKWNTADSRFLEPTVRPPTAPNIDLPGQARRLPGLKWALSATSKASGKRTIARWQWQVLHPYKEQNMPGCRFSDATVREPKFWCNADVGLGGFRLSATVWDNKGSSNVTELDIVLATPSTLRKTKLTLTSSPAGPLPVGGGTVKVTAKLVDVETGKPVIGMPMSLSGGSSDWNARTSPAGTVVRSKTLTATTTFYGSSYGTMVWRPANASRRVAVALPPSTITATLRDASGPITSPATVALNESITVSGTVSPDRDPSSTTVKLQELVGGTWTDTWSTAGVTSAGTFRFADWTIETWTEGTRTYRVVKPAGSYAQAVSATLTVTVAKTPVTITAPASTAAPYADGFVEIPLTATAPADDLAWRLQVQRRAVGATTWSADPFTAFAGTDGLGGLHVTVWAQGECPWSDPCGPATYEYRVGVSNDDTYLNSWSNAFTVAFTP
jgi:hypothetical protein